MRRRIAKEFLNIVEAAQAETKIISSKKAKEFLKLLDDHLQSRLITVPTHVDLAIQVIEKTQASSRYTLVQSEIDFLTRRLEKGSLRAAFINEKKLDVATLFSFHHYESSVPRLLNEMLGQYQKGQLSAEEVTSLFDKVQWQRLSPEADGKYRAAFQNLSAQPQP